MSRFGPLSSVWQASATHRGTMSYWKPPAALCVRSGVERTSTDPCSLCLPAQEPVRDRRTVAATTPSRRRLRSPTPAGVGLPPLTP